MTTLTDFLLARIAEDEELWRLAIDSRLTFVASGRTPVVPPPGFSERKLAECEAKRRIVALHQQDGDRHWCMEGCGMRAGGPDWPCETLATLALPYADHPDYRDEWRS